MTTRRRPKQPNMTAFTLPDGYDLEAPEQPRVLDAAPGHNLYGGADISRIQDAAGVSWVGCCARKVSTGDFRFRAYALINGVWTEPSELEPRASGRGELFIDWYTGKPIWTAWEQSTFFYGDLPGAAAYPSIVALTARLAAAEAKLAVVTSKAANVEILMHRVEEAGIRTQWALEALTARVNGIAAGELTDEELAQLRVVRVA